MSRDKQIEEMAKDLLNVSNKVSNIIMKETHEFLSQNHKYSSLKDFHKAHPKGRFQMEAELLTELGYAKASEVALEVLTEFERFLVEKLSAISAFRKSGDAFYDGEIHALELLLYKNAELKKKYTEGEI